MVIIPTSRIILLKNPIEIDYMNELTFVNANAQYNYFYNLPKLECDNATYQRKDGVIRFPTDPNMEGVTYDDLIQYNYCMYQNDKWSNKWFYAFIKNVTYDNAGMSLIEIETDVWQSWCFDITFKNSFIEREHVNSDNVGEHTVPEGLETGEYIIDNKIKNNDYSEICFILATTTFPYITQQDGQWVLDGGNAATCNVYNSILSGLEYFWYTNTSNGITRLQNTIKAYANSGKSDSIYMLFTAPTRCFEKVLENPNEGFWGSVKQKQGSYNTPWGSLATSDIYRPTSLNGYTPKNKKLLTYPYCYLLMNNGNGGNAIYQYELFKNDDQNGIIYFEIENAICPGCSIFLRPVQYKYNDPTFKDTMDGLPLGKFPMCSWNSDAYINWLTQNSANVKYGFLSQAYNIGANVAQQNIIGAGSGLLGGISNVMQLYNKRDTATPQAEGNTNSGDVVYSMGETTFTAYQMSIKQEYARIIDGYFNMFGYKVNTVKQPNITGRAYWNYVKTIGCNIIGDIPQEDLQKIKDMFNNGVTMWHSTTHFLDYSQNNTIV